MDTEEQSELIDTAIVIKNIPYQYPEEDFINKLFPELRLVPPYVFNYHRNKSSPAFQGLAFANFNTSDDARAAVDKLNNFELERRRLRVELKRRLPAGEEQRKRLAKRSNQQITAQMNDILDPALRPCVVYPGPPTPTPQTGTTNICQAD